MSIDFGNPFGLWSKPPVTETPSGTRNVQPASKKKSQINFSKAINKKEHTKKSELTINHHFQHIKQNKICRLGLKVACLLSMEIITIGTLVASLSIFPNVLNFSIKSSWIRAIGEGCVQGVLVPTEIFTGIFTGIAPDIRIKGYRISRMFITTTIEELVYRGIIQRVAPHLVSKALPKRYGDILNHKVTRVALSSIVFALVHQTNWNRPAGVLPQLLGGLLYGAVVEMDESLLTPIFAHFIHDFIMMVAIVNFSKTM